MSLSKPANFEHAQATIKCDHCGGVDDVKHYCLICEETICPTCKAIHNKARATRDHQVVLREERHNKDQTSTICKKHPDQRTSLECDTCNVPVCIKCVAETHYGHKFSGILENYKREIAESKMEMEKRMMEINVLILKGKQSWNNYAKMIKSIESSISNDGIALHSLVDKLVIKRKDQLKRITHEDRASWETANGKLVDEKTKISTSLEQHDKYLSSTTATGMAELLEESKLLQRKLLDPIEISPPSYQSPSHTSIEGIGEIIKQTKVPSVVPSRELQVGRAVFISSFSSALDGAPSICYAGKDLILLGSDKSMNIHILDREGKIAQKRENVLKNACFSLAVTPAGDVIVSPSTENCIVKLNKQNELTELFNASPYEMLLISVTENQGILVCLTRFVAGKQKGRVILCDGKGGLQRRIGSDDLYEFPFQAVALHDGGFCISDYSKQRLVVLNANCNVRHIIQNPLGWSRFLPRGICTDKAGNILATDQCNDCVYLIGKDMSVIELARENVGIIQPRCLCVDDDNNLWIAQDNGKIKVVKYFEEL